MNAKSLLALTALAGLAALASLAGCEKEPLPPANLQFATANAPTISTSAGEVDLVEKMTEYRNGYKAYLEAMEEYYRKHGDYTKLVCAEKELGDLVHKSRTYNYLMVADVPPSNATKPTENVPAANVLYEDGMHYYKSGRIIGIPLAYSKDQMRLAVEKFNTLIKQYPNSDKVALAFYQAAEILKEYLGEDLQAIEYYQRAYEADPSIPYPAHFQRATVLDYRLHRRDEAVAEYQNVLKYEMNSTHYSAKSNAEHAASRIKELTKPQ